MIILLSPAKTLDFESAIPSQTYTVPNYLDKSQKLADKMRKLSPGGLTKLLDISTDLANLNHERYQNWYAANAPGQARQAVFAFKGDVYTGLQAETFAEEDLLFAQKHLRVLSGLYGVLKPTDLIMPHRLEMGTSLGIGTSKDLYAYWKTTITKAVSEALEQSGTDVILNLASAEYFKSVDFKKIGARVIAPAFKDFKNGEYIMISFFAKKARGMMASFIIRNRITEAGQFDAFEQDGYHFNSSLSTADKPVFTRG